MNPLFYMKALIAALLGASGVLTQVAATQSHLTLADYIIAGGTALISGAATYAASNKTSNTTDSQPSTDMEFPPGSITVPSHNEIQ